MTQLNLETIFKAPGADWTVWPPRDDPAWRPDPGDEYWLPGIECADPAARDEPILAKLSAQVRYA
ncbi:MAG: hypothetical protein HYS36_10530 [Candidatus Rokubacteria bacterium]|nr:hypothetical protein [Candidatus Rokubacteria bacterium]